MLVAGALRKLLEPRFEIVGAVYNCTDLLDVAARLKPDLVILDLGMLSLNGQNISEQLKELLPDIKQIVLAINDGPELAADSLQKWVSGFLLKSSAGTALIRSIKKVLKGKAYVPPRMTQRAFDRFIRDLRTEREKRLTPRQRKVLQLLAEGRTMKEAAEELHITPRTIAFHKYRMMEEFGLETNSDLFRFAVEERVISAS
jgi:DNA-binding NarL/FixJ family response regulator